VLHQNWFLLTNCLAKFLKNTKHDDDDDDDDDDDVIGYRTRDLPVCSIVP
jgi:hypothetical protein